MDFGEISLSFKAKSTRNLHPKLILAHRLRTHHMIQPAQILLKHFYQDARCIIDQHWAKFYIGKSAHAFVIGQVVVERTRRGFFCRSNSIHKN